MDVLRIILVIMTFVFVCLMIIEQDLIYILSILISFGPIGYINILHENEEYMDVVKDASKVNFVIKFFLFFKRPSLYQSWAADLEAIYFKNWFGSSIRYKKEISGKETVIY